MSIGEYLRRMRNDRQLSLRDVQQLAREQQLGAELSSGYLSMLERNEVKEPSPRILHTLATIYEIDYIDLMRKASYIPPEVDTAGAPPAVAAFRGASQLSKEQKERVQRMIDFELSESQRGKRRRSTERTDG